MTPEKITLFKSVFFHAREKEEETIDIYAVIGVLGGILIKVATLAKFVQPRLEKFAFLETGIPAETCQ